MIRIEAVCLQVSGVAPSELADWIARGWVQPQGEPPDWAFGEIEVARVRLVRDLRSDAGIAADDLEVVLSLLDQVHDLRRALGAIMAGLRAQPASVRQAVLAFLPPTRG